MSRKKKREIPVIKLTLAIIETFRFEEEILLKSHAPLYPFDKPIKSLSFRSFVVSVLFARFHFKVIRKSLYSRQNDVWFTREHYLVLRECRPRGWSRLRISSSLMSHSSQYKPFLVEKMVAIILFHHGISIHIIKTSFHEPIRIWLLMGHLCWIRYIHGQKRNTTLYILDSVHIFYTSFVIYSKHPHIRI